MANRKNGTATLLDPAFGRKVAGGLFLEFEGGIRVVKNMGWITELVQSSNNLAIQLDMLLYRSKDIWEINQSPAEIYLPVHEEKPISLYLCSGGGEYHFAPPEGNHFSLYPVDALYNPHLIGTIKGLEHYRDRALRALNLAAERS